MLRHVNPDSHMDKCPVLTSESLGQHFYNNLGKYHKACRVRYSNSRATQLKTKISEVVRQVSMKPASKAAKRERHVSAHDNTNAALMSAGIDAVRTFLLEQEEVLPKLCLVSDL